MKKLILLTFTILITTLAGHCGDEAWSKIEKGWSRMPIRIYLDNTGDYTTMIEEGFNEWEEKTDGEVRFKFVTRPHSGYANITVKLVRNFTDSTAGLTKAQMGVNKIYKSNIDVGLYSANGRKFSNEELAIIIKHEIGHSLGLPHSNDKKSIMFPYVLRGQSITDKDIENLMELY